MSSEIAQPLQTTKLKELNIKSRNFLYRKIKNITNYP